MGNEREDAEAGPTASQPSPSSAGEDAGGPAAADREERYPASLKRRRPRQNVTWPTGSGPRRTSPTSSGVRSRSVQIWSSSRTSS